MAAFVAFSPVWLPMPSACVVVCCMEMRHSINGGSVELFCKTARIDRPQQTRHDLNAESGTECEELISCGSLCEEIGNLLQRWNMSYAEITTFNLLTNSVKISGDVF